MAIIVGILAFSSLLANIACKPDKNRSYDSSAPNSTVKEEDLQAQSEGASEQVILLFAEEGESDEALYQNLLDDLSSEGEDLNLKNAKKA